MGKRAEQKKETLERLRSVIDELVAQKGFDAVTIREICECAGVSTGVFYYYFHSKDDILFDRYLRAESRWDIDQQVKLDALSPHEALRTIIQDTVRYTLSRVPSISLPYHKTIMSEYQSWTQMHPDTLRTLLRRHFQRAHELGMLKTTPHSPRQLADMLWSMNYGMRFCMHLDGFSFCEETNIPDQLLDWLDNQFID